MDTESIIQLIVIILLLALSAFFSSAETAFTTANRIKIRSLIEEGNKRAIIVDKVIQNQSKMLSAILIGNNIVNISASALATTFTINVFGSYATGIATGILTILVLLFGEITPKSAATLKSESIALFYAPIINALMYILTPVIIIVDVLSGFLFKLLRLDHKKAGKGITEAELRTFVQVSHEEGVIETDEKEIINNLFNFTDSEAKEVMIPRIDMTMADVNTPYDEIIELFRETQFTRIPVYENDPDNIIGVLNIKDLVFSTSKDRFDIRNIIREVYFTYEHKNTSDLFKQMQKESQSVAIVLDEYGTTVGMITTEDLLEEIVGEIRDEYDKDEMEPFTTLSPNVYRIDASYKIDDINNTIGSSLESEDNDSIGGYIIERLDRIPKIGDCFKIDNLEFIVEKATSTRIERILMKVHPAPLQAD